MELNTYIIEGGVGKITAFTALIPKLAVKNKNKIQVHTPYVDCLVSNPDVLNVFSSEVYLNHPEILKSNNIYYSEPYKSNFAFGKEHLIQSYCNLFGVECDETVIPKLYTSNYKERAKNWLIKNKINKYMMVQFSGGQSPLTFNNNYISTNPGRNYPPYLAFQVIKKLKKMFPELTIIDCTLMNEPSFPETIKCDEHFTIIHELLKDSEGFIGIDSCLNHFSASTKTSGVVLWGNTRWTNFGYTHNINLNNFMDCNKWNENNFDPNDPRNIMVDPELIFNSYISLFKSEKKQVSCLFN